MSTVTLASGGTVRQLEHSDDHAGPILDRISDGGNVPIGTTNHVHSPATFQVGDDVYTFKRDVVVGQCRDPADNLLSREELTDNPFLNKLWQWEFGRALAISEGVNAFVLNGEVEYVLPRGTTSEPRLLLYLFDDREEVPEIVDTDNEEEEETQAGATSDRDQEDDDDQNTLVDSESQEQPKQDSAEAEAEENEDDSPLN